MGFPQTKNEKAFLAHIGARNACRPVNLTGAESD
jgi:hypothetical protein